MAFLGPPVRWPDALPIDNDASPFYPLASSLRRILPGPLATLPSSILVSITLTFLLITGIAIFSAALNARRSSLLVSEKAVPASSSATQRRKSGQPITALLVGPEQTGKSSIFSALVFQAVPETQTSQHENESRIMLRAEGQGEKAVEQPVQLVDLPGHPRLRGRVGDFLSVADKIVFCVDTTTAIRGASTKNDTLIEAVDQLHSTLTSLARLRLSRSASRSLPPPPSLLVLFTRGDLSPLLSASPYDTKRQSQVVARARAAFEQELGRRRAGMGLGRGAAGGQRRAKVGGMSEVVSGGSAQGSGGFFGAIKSLLGLGGSKSAASSAKPGLDEEDDDEDAESADYVDWSWSQRNATFSDSAGSGATSFSLDRLDADVVSGGKASFAVACLGKERGWAMSALQDEKAAEGSEEGFQGLKTVREWLADSAV